MRSAFCALMTGSLIAIVPTFFMLTVMHAQASDSDGEGNMDPNSAFGAVEAVEGSGNVDVAQRDPDQAVRSGPSRPRQVHSGARTYDPDSFLPFPNERGEAQPSTVSQAPSLWASVVEQSQRRVEGWRYKWHNGHWWYYQRNNQWLFWNGGSWSTYSPQSYSRWYAGQFRLFNRLGVGYGRARYYRGYRGTGDGGTSPGYEDRNPYDYDAYAPYNTDAPPGARIGAAIIGGSSGPEAARAARVGENN